jgi:hypothetical protein
MEPVNILQVKYLYMFHPESGSTSFLLIVLEALFVHIQGNMVRPVSDGMDADLKAPVERPGCFPIQDFRGRQRQSSVARVIAVRLYQRGAT